jgi:hypothetical protein
VIDDSLRVPPGPAVGGHVGGYLLAGQIGHGGMAVVFRADDQRLGRQVALKVLAPEFASDREFRQRFIRESRAAAAVDDPHIIPVFEAGQDGQVLFIAMRLVGGGDVSSLIRREGPLAADRAAAIVAPVASALDAAHAAGLVHRDVKPANMLLDSRPGRPDHVYLSDFGLSKAVTAAALTETGMFMGTAQYTAPEQASGGRVDGRTDQYALACAAFEMLTGRPPFPGPTAMAVLLAHQSDQPPRLTERRPDLPREADQVFDRALAKSPAHRYTSCTEFSEALRAALGIAPYADSDQAKLDRDASRPGPAGSRGRKGRNPGRRLAAILALTAAVAVAVGLTVFLAGPRHGRQTADPASAWVTYHDQSGFSIGLPAGWAVTSHARNEVRFTGAPPGFVIVVGWGHKPKPDALTDSEQHAAAAATVNPAYRQIRITRVSYRGYNAADWEFTSDYLGVPTHYLDRDIIVDPGHLGYALELYGPPSQWPATHASIWGHLLATFRPA